MKGMQAVILAGGRGTRLKPYTFRAPKPLLPLAGKPFILYMLDYLKSYQITDILLSLCYKADEIMEFLGDGSRYGVNIQFSVEQEPLGTAGALRNVEAYLKPGSVLVFNGDLLTDIDLSRLIATHKKKNAKASIALKEVDDPSPFGLVLMDREGRVKRFIEKPTEYEATQKTINAGIYLLDTEILSRIPPATNFSFERDLFPMLLDEHFPFYGVVFDSYWLDVGTLSTYMRAHRDILSGKVKVVLPGKKGDKRSIWLGEDVRLHPSCHISEFVLIGDKVVVEEEVYIGEYTVIGSRGRLRKQSALSECILFDGVVVGERARVRESVLGQDSIVEDDVVIRSGNILGDGSLVTRGSILPSAM